MVTGKSVPAVEVKTVSHLVPFVTGIDDRTTSFQLALNKLVPFIVLSGIIYVARIGRTCLRETVIVSEISRYVLCYGS